LKVINVHQRLLHASPERVGALIDSLSSPVDALWPRKSWPRMSFDRPLAVGARGGHGPIRYFVEAYEPGESIRFRFTGPKGVEGWHAFEILDATAMHCVLEHRVEADIRGMAILSWLLAFRPMHDVLVQEALSQAQKSLGLEPRPVPWPASVRLLRWLMASRKRHARRNEGKPHAG
jgi:hypothetical protein